MLLEMGNADPNFPADSPYHLPLRTAVRARSAEMCRLLVEFDACVDGAVEIDKAAKVMRLKDRLDDEELEVRVLKELEPAWATGAGMG